MQTSVLHPMSIGDILDRAINLYRRNFVTLLGIAAVVTVPIAILQLIGILLAFPLDLLSLNSSPSRTTESLAAMGYLGMFVVFFIAGVIGFVGYAFQSAAMVFAVSESFLGRTITIRQAYQGIWGRVGSLLGGLFILTLLNGLVMGFFFACSFIPLIFAAASGRTDSSASSVFTAGIALLICAGFGPLMIALLVINMRFLMMPQTITLEKVGALAGMRRSWNLVRGSFWRVLFTAFLMYAFITILTAMPSYAVTFTAFLIPSVAVQTVLNTAVGTVVGVVTTPLYLAVLTILYYDLRIRSEGLDLELRAQEMLVPAEPTP